MYLFVSVVNKYYSMKFTVRFNMNTLLDTLTLRVISKQYKVDAL